MSKTLSVNLCLLLVAIIWGFGFIPQKIGLNYFSPSAFNAMRFALGALTLIPIMLAMKSVTLSDASKVETIKLGVLLGGLLFAGALLQQISLLYTSVANVAFITGLYAIIVPMIGYFLGYRYGLIVWFGGLLAIAGLYLMTGGGNSVSLKGDLIALIGAVFWAIHLLFLVKRAGRHQQMVLAFYQFIFCAIFSLIFAVASQDSLLPSAPSGYLWPLINGVIVVGVAYTLQVLVLSDAEPFSASLILSLEAVFGAIAGYLFFAESLERLAFFGAFLMLLGCVLAQRESS